MPIIFIAVQCVQCCTMQVKQQKKSNKWVCAVCNQRQSVLQIHARGFLARDIRKFVQEFNLSRMKQESRSCDSFSPKSDGLHTASEIGSASSFGVEPACLPKRRTDWSDALLLPHKYALKGLEFVPFFESCKMAKISVLLLGIDQRVDGASTCTKKKSETNLLRKLQSVSLLSAIIV
ncbi:hypothetical protein M5K25_022208 [Dendrobium thyrsiflorum]|uniref:MRN complex-interacting protein N-terminal domain-containing protein n=1 Tax=Dendrobium thyrsiflorum TaxID=117978 RepID=A0ABD0U5V1_DENTH